MRVAGILVLGAALLLSNCTRHSDANNANDKKPDTVGERAGRAAYYAAKEARAAAQKAGQEIQHGAKQMHKGWTEASQKEREKRATDSDRDR